MTAAGVADVDGQLVPDYMRAGSRGAGDFLVVLDNVAFSGDNEVDLGSFNVYISTGKNLDDLFWEPQCECLAELDLVLKPLEVNRGASPDGLGASVSNTFQIKKWLDFGQDFALRTHSEHQF